MTDVVHIEGDEERAVPGMLVGIGARLLGFAIMMYEADHRECMTLHMVEHVQDNYLNTMVAPEQVLPALAALAANMLAIDPITGEIHEPTEHTYEMVLGSLKGIAEKFQDPFTMAEMAEDITANLASLLDEER